MYFWCTWPRVISSNRERVRKIALKLREVEAGTTFGFPAFKVGGKTFAWFPKKKEVEEGSLGVRMSFVDRDLRIAANPDAFYVTPHYQDYPSVLVRVWELTDVQPAKCSRPPTSSRRPPGQTKNADAAICRARSCCRSEDPSPSHRARGSSSATMSGRGSSWLSRLT